MQNIKYVEDAMTLTNKGMSGGLDKVKEYLQLLGNPQEKLKVFHIAGTNGKGTTSNMIYQVLYKQFGYKVGIFTSPHIVQIKERFQINGTEIENSVLDNYFGEVIKKSKKMGIDFSFFEICTIVSIQYFLDEKVDYAVIETGIGGTYDSTNVFLNPIATYITSISKDHTHLLGKTLLSIQKNKMGIMKPQVPIYTHIGNKLMVNGASRIGANLRIIKDKISTNLNGEHQKYNASLIYHSLVDLGFDKDKISKGLQNIEMIGRLQFIEKDVLLDGSHNEGSIKQLKKFLKTLKYKKLITIFGLIKKSYDSISCLGNIVDSDIKILTKPTVYKGTNPKEYKKLIKGNTVIIQNPKDALQYAKSIKQDGDLIVIYGSLFLLGDVVEN